MARNREDVPDDDPFVDGLEVENEEDWYFDLPDGAWERQEEKNQSLRERLLDHAGNRNRPLPTARPSSTESEPSPEPSEPDDSPKADTEESDPKAPKKRGWRLGFRRSDEAHETPVAEHAEDGDLAPWALDDDDESLSPDLYIAAEEQTAADSDEPADVDESLTEDFDAAR